MIYEKRYNNGKLQMLVANDAMDSTIENITRSQVKANCFVNVSTKVYRGSKFENCTWIVIG